VCRDLHSAAEEVAQLWRTALDVSVDPIERL
jgi:hypothetical protein